MGSTSSRAAPHASLERLARRAGVLTRYVDMWGNVRSSPAAVVRALCSAVSTAKGIEDTGVTITTVGRRTLRLEPGQRIAGPLVGGLQLEDGGVIAIRTSRGARAGFQLREPIPPGVQQLRFEGNHGLSRIYVLARPKSLAGLVDGPHRHMSVFLPLYSVKPGGPFGIGSYTDLQHLSAWADRTAGALLGTLPLYPAFLDRPFEPSPYAPVSRLMWNELFVDPRRSPEWSSPGVRRLAASDTFIREADSARSGPHVDYRGSWRIARRMLKAMAAAARTSPGRWSAILSQSSAETIRYATFRAAVDATGKSWDAWPAAWRERGIEPSAVRPRDIELYVYAQALASEQLATFGRTAAARSPLYLDLPIGVHAHGFDTFTRPDLFLHDFSAGAPPDALNASGQVWGFPPMHPTAGRADGYAHLRAVLRRMLSIAGVLRIDHIMGLYRMFCVPTGHNGGEGAYVRYPERELFAIVMIEAPRAGAIVVGEDLGTVPPPVRRLMKKCGILGMHVQQFALGGSHAGVIQPAGAHVLASLNTHDTPTFSGFWHADDVSLRVSLGHQSRADAARERAHRAVTRRAVRRELTSRGLSSRSGREAAMSLYRLQARGRAPITLINLEDLWGERRPQNVPGTSTEHANWRRRAARSLRAILRDRALAADLACLCRERGSTRGRKARS